MPDYEYAVQCPNPLRTGLVLHDPDRVPWLRGFATYCDLPGNCCGTAPHTVVRRSLAWEQVPTDE